MDKIDEVLTRGVEKILPSKESLANVMSERKITLYQGFDTTAPSLHIGNFVGLRKLAQFQELGHKVIFLIGDFTGMIGDPTNKSATRVRQTRKEVLENLKDYKDQAGRILKFDGENAAEIKFNYDWLSKLTFEDVIELAAHFTAQQMLERDFFQDRLKKKMPIYLHEFLYPLMQGYDSVAMDVDLEVAGSDQMFNALAGRTLMKNLKGKEKYCLTTKLLEDLRGKKMGKTEGNAIFLRDSAEDIYAKVMAFTDGMLPSAVELLTDLPLYVVDLENPLDLKKKVAIDVAAQIHGKEKALEAQKEFEKTFQRGMPEFSETIATRGTLAETLAELKEVGSKSNAKRLIKDGAIDVNGKTIDDPERKLTSGDEIKIGKKTFVKIK